MYFCKVSNKKYTTPESGQTLVIIVFVMLLALSVGISSSSRFIKGLRSNTETQINYRSGAVAEAALERILLKSADELDDYITYGSCGADCTLSITNSDGLVETANVMLSRLGNSSDSFELHVFQNQVTEINLSGYPNNTDVDVCWDDPSSGDYPSLVGILITGTTGNYQADAFAYNSVSSTETNNFSTTSASNGLDNCFTINSATDPQVIRMRALYQDTNVTVFPDASATIPTQGILIESTGNVLESQTTVTAIKGNNVVPYLFDYAVFSKSEFNPLAN